MMSDDPIVRELSGLGELRSRDDDGGTLATLHARLVDGAEADGLLDVAYRMLDSPLGPLLVARTERGLVKVSYAVEDHDVVLTRLADRISPRVLRAPARFDDVARQLDEYFAVRRRSFDLPVDLRLTTRFRRTVLEHLRVVPYGSTISYGGLAQAAGRPTAARATGTACATNPLPIVIPCHRVVRADGAVGQYVGGAAAKRQLLDLESAPEDR